MWTMTQVSSPHVHSTPFDPALCSWSTMPGLTRCAVLTSAARLMQPSVALLVCCSGPGVTTPTEQRPAGTHRHSSAAGLPSGRPSRCTASASAKPGCDHRVIHSGRGATGVGHRLDYAAQTRLPHLPPKLVRERTALCTRLGDGLPSCFGVPHVAGADTCLSLACSVSYWLSGTAVSSVRVHGKPDWQR